MADNPRQDLYLEISRNLVDQELTDLRNYVSGAKILPARFVQHADAHQICNQLEKEQKLKPGDLSLMADLLRKIGRNDYAEKAEKVAENERKGSPQPCTSQLKRKGEDGEEFPGKKKPAACGEEGSPVGDVFQKSVKKYYELQLSHLKPLIWNDNFTLILSDIFTQLELIPKCEKQLKTSEKYNRSESRREEQRKELKSLDNLFNPDVTGLSTAPRCILIEGEAGGGKTTFLSKEALDAVSQKTELGKRHSTVLFIRLREVKEGETIAEIVWDQCVPERKGVTIEFIETMLEQNESRVLFLLDGYDELQPEARAAGQAIPKLLSGKLYPNSTIVITSRPSAGVQQHTRPDCHVHIMGFSKEHVEKYMQQYFTVVKKQELTKNLVVHVKDNELLNTLIYTPIFLMFVCVLWEEDQEMVSTGTMTGLYDNLLTCLVRRYCKREGVDMPTEGLPTEVAESLLQFGKLALEALLRNETLLDLTEAERENVNWELLLKLGVVSLEVSSSKLHPRKQLNFFHKTMQEFLAGRYVAHAQLNQQDIVELLQLTSIIKALELSNLLQFTCSCDSRAAQAVMEELSKISRREFTHLRPDQFESSHVPMDQDIKKSCQTYKRFAALCLSILSERQEPEVLQGISQALPIVMLDSSINSREATGLQYYIQNLHSANLPDRVILKVPKGTGSRDTVQYLQQCFRTPLPGLRLDLELSGQFDSPDETARLVSVLNNVPGLRALDLSLTRLTPSSLQPLVQGFSHMSLLEELDLTGNDLGDAGMEVLQVGLSSVPHLAVLRLGGDELLPIGVGMTAVGMSSLAPYIRHLVGLRVLDISSNYKIGDTGLESLTTILPIFTAMQVLVLSWIGISPTGMRILFGKLALEALLRNETLLDLTEAERENVNWELLLKLGVVSLEVSSSKLHPRKQLNFFHKTMQEFLAGRYVAHAQLNQQDIVELLQLTSIIKALELSNLLQFTCSCDSRAAQAVMEELSKISRREFTHLRPDQFESSHVPMDQDIKKSCQTYERFAALCLSILSERQEPEVLQGISQALPIVILDSSINSREATGLKYYIQNLHSANLPDRLILKVPYGTDSRDTVQYLQQCFTTPLPGLTLDLRLSGRFGSPDETARLVSVLNNVPGLRALNLSLTRLTPSSLQPLMQGFSHMSLLEELVLSLNDNLGDAGMEVLQVGLSGVPHLAVLRLGGLMRGVGMTAVGMSSLAPYMRHLVGLRVLDISSNQIGDTGLESLATILPIFTAMQVLVLCSIGISPTGMHTLVPALCQLTRLIKLDISHNDIGDPGLECLAAILHHLTAMKVLALRETGISDRGISSLIKALPHLVQLQGLDVSGNNIGDSGIVSLVQTLCQPSSLDMEQNPPGDKSLTTAPHCNTTLQKLHIGLNKGVTGAGLGRVAQLISALPALTWLGMSGYWDTPAHLSDTAAMALAEALPRLPALKWLDLWNISMDHAGFQAVVQTAEEHPTLGRLHVYIQFQLYNNTGVITGVFVTGVAVPTGALQSGPLCKYASRCKVWGSQVWLSRQVPSGLDPCVWLSRQVPSSLDPCVWLSRQVPSGLDPCVWLSRQVPSSLDPCVSTPACAWRVYPHS
uniref:NACHT domain-containing protein n=1 Tax=Branchiostoma floridae TaxID=7739 RepID=C3ZL03_BRAFL|eukprot:XP_002590674.1 hypothetical protein BRAFLDRAFT_89475 [Branchiostoma floridae]